MKEGYIKKEDRKKILLLTDDIRVHSGVANVGREIVTHTSHRYNWVQMAGAIRHPEKGKPVDLSEAINKDAGIEDSSVILFPVDAYGDPKSLREVLRREKPDALFLITDPRYFEWLFQIENEVRSQIPIAYLNIWDDLPAPMYNREFYDSCDALFGISKQTVNINKLVLGKEKCKNKIIKYIPHGLNNNTFRPLSNDDSELKETRDRINNGVETDFTLFFNSRNIRRKCISDLFAAWKVFKDGLPKAKQDKVALILHTAPVDDNGTDLYAIRDLLFGDDPNILFSDGRITPESMNVLYNMADVTILPSSNEGWGLALTESMMAGTMILANTTGGMQDQMRFEDENGEWFTPSPEIPSNNTGRYKKHGEWAFPVYPACRSIQGSPVTPYIFDDRCKPEDATDRIREVYDLGKEKRKELGLKGREWCLSDEAGFNAKSQGENFIGAVNELFSKWEPREAFEVIDTDEDIRKIQTHNLVY